MCLKQTKLLLDQHLMHNRTKTSNLNAQSVFHGEELRPGARKKKHKKTDVSCVFVPNTNELRSFDPFIKEQTAPRDPLAE